MESSLKCSSGPNILMKEQTTAKFGSLVIPLQCFEVGKTISFISLLSVSIFSLVSLTFKSFSDAILNTTSGPLWELGTKN